MSKKSSKPATEAEKEVQITLGLMEYSETLMKLKVRRGKRLALVVSNVAPYFIIKEKAIEKWRAYHSDTFDDMQEYILLLENLQEAQFLPGGKAEFFSLKRYREELGKDYNKITLYLCKRSDFNESMGCDDSDGSGEFSVASFSKKQKTEDYTQERMQLDDDLQRELEFPLISPLAPALYDSTWIDAIPTQLAQRASATCDNGQSNESAPSTSAKSKEESIDLGQSNESAPSTSAKSKEESVDLESLVKSFEAKVIKGTAQFFIVVRRNATLSRAISLWQRESAKVSPEKILRVKFLGESGIDTGALAKEFLTATIFQMEKTVFPLGVPIDSMLNVANGFLKTCGEIAAVSISQGGPPPRFLAESSFDLMVSEENEVGSIEKYITDSDSNMLAAINGSIKENIDTIIDHGYTGVIDNDHKDEIIATIKVSMMSRRSVYLREFRKGLHLHGIAEALQQHPSILKPLFVKQENDEKVDANYLVSILVPLYSDSEPTKLAAEERVLDNLQDCIMGLEDGHVTGYAEAITYEEEIEDATSEVENEMRSIEMTPAGVLGWLTGQQHKPVNGEQLQITVRFDHDCMERNPSHKICFPIVKACSKDITLPVIHMLEKSAFDANFMLAYCKGNSFGNA